MSTATGALGINSDDFSGATFPEAVWDAFDDSPTNDCTLSREGFGTADARAVINVPTGADHEAWTTFTAPYWRQATTSSAGDFEVTTKIESIPFSGSSYQDVGILAWTDSVAITPACVYFYDNGTYTAWCGNIGAGNEWGGTDIGLVTPIWLRMGRVSGVWSCYYSSDGSSFTLIATDENSPSVRTAPLQYIGLYAGNLSAAPTFDAKFDYFFESSAIISPEDDAGTPSTPRIMVIT